MPRQGELSGASASREHSSTAGPGAEAPDCESAPGPERQPAHGVQALRGDPSPGALRALLHGFYDLLWLCAVPIAVPYVFWRSRRNPGTWRMIREQLGAGLKPLEGTRPRVLVHGVSVGEVKGAQPLVRSLAEALPELEVVLSTTTNTGMAVAHDLFPDQRVVRFPADLSLSVERFLDRVRPDFVVLIELEIWPNFLRRCNRRGIPIVIVNGRITDKSHGRYRLFKNLLPQFNRISLFCVQSEEYARRFARLDVDPRRILVTGNVKADGLEVAEAPPAGDDPEAEELRRLFAIGDEDLVWVAGSTHHPEESQLLRAWREAAPHARLIVVPRHPQRSPEIAREFEREGYRPTTLSRLRSGADTPDPTNPVLVDTIGELERIYRLSDLVFVGGSLIPHGGQNMLEPAAQGKAVLFGPSVHNFALEAALLLERGACRQVQDVTTLATAVCELVADAGERERMGIAAREAVRAQKGAVRRTLRALSELGLGQLVWEDSSR